MIYVIDHYYAISHKDFLLVVKMDEGITEIIEIINVINYLYEKRGRDEDKFNECLLKVLTSVYGAIDIKDTLSEEEISTIKVPIDTVYKKIIIPHSSIELSEAFIIDLYEAVNTRSECMLDKWLPKGEKLNKLNSILNNN